MLLNPLIVLLNGNDARPITAELVESDIPQKRTELLCIISELIYQ